MKKYIKPFLLLCSMLITANLLIAQKVSFEEIKKQCSGISNDKRVRLSVSSFEVATPAAYGRFGDDLSQMLTNALQNVNCFNVLLSIKDSKALTDEIGFGQSGNTVNGTSPQAGKMKGAQVIVLGKVTEYSSGEKKAGAFGINVTGGTKAKVGFIIQLINAETRELIDSKSINVEGKTGGFSGVKVFGLEMAGATNNRAIQDACEKGIIQAVEFIGSNKDNMPMPEITNGVAEVKGLNASNNAVPLINVATPPQINVAMRQSTDRDHPTQLTNFQIDGEKIDKDPGFNYYTFLAGPGEVILSVNGKSDNYMYFDVNLFNTDAEPIASLSILETKGDKREVKRFKLAQRQRLIMQIAFKEQKDLQYMVRLEGAIEIAKPDNKENNSVPE